MASVYWTRSGKTTTYNATDSNAWAFMRVVEHLHMYRPDTVDLRVVVRKWDSADEQSFTRVDEFLYAEANHFGAQRSTSLDSADRVEASQNYGEIIGHIRDQATFYVDVL